MAPKLYLKKQSPPCRAALMVSKALDLELELEHIDFPDLLTPEMLKINPQHTIPILVDDDYILWDSHAISGYLVGQYGSDDSLYPTDIRQRALVDQRLHFDTGILFPRFCNLIRPIMFNGAKEFDEEAIDKVKEAYNLLEEFLEGREWLAGDEMTIADLCNAATVSSMESFVPIEEERHEKLIAWLSKCKELPYYTEYNQEGLDLLKEAVQEKMNG